MAKGLQPPVDRLIFDQYHRSEDEALWVIGLQGYVFAERVGWGFFAFLGRRLRSGREGGLCRTDQSERRGYEGRYCK